MMIPHPTQVLLNLLQPQCLHSFMQQFIADIIISLRLILECERIWQAINYIASICGILHIAPTK